MSALVALMAVLAASTGYELAIEQATAAYREAEFEASMRALNEAQPLADTDARRVEVALLQGIMLANLSSPEATVAWERALAIDEAARLPVAVSSKVRVEFERVQQSVQRIKRSLDRPVVAQASPVAVASGVTARVGVARWVTAGIALGVGLVAAGVGVGFGVDARSHYDRAVEASFAAQKRALYATGQTSATWANASYIAAGVFAVGALIAFLLIETPDTAHGEALEPSPGDSRFSRNLRPFESLRANGSTRSW